MPVYSNEDYNKLTQGQFTGSDAAIYTATAPLKAVIIKHIRLVNTDTSDRTVTLYHTTGGAGAAASTILPATTIKAGAWAEFDGVIVLEQADTLRGLASVTTVVTYTVYGLELS